MRGVLCNLAKSLYWSHQQLWRNQKLQAQLQPTVLKKKMRCTRGNSSFSNPLQIPDLETIKAVLGPLWHLKAASSHAGLFIHQWLCPYKSNIPMQPARKTS